MSSAGVCGMGLLWKAFHALTEEGRTEAGAARARQQFEEQALAELTTIPIGAAWNVTLVDPGQAVTVYLGPDIPMAVAPDACATNHQHLPVPDGQEQFSRTQERLAAVRANGDDVAAMLKPPLYQVKYDEGLGTVYTRCTPGSSTR